MDGKAVGANAGLTAEAELASDKAVDGLVEVGILEDSEHSVATKLERAPEKYVGQRSGAQGAKLCIAYFFSVLEAWLMRSLPTGDWSYTFVSLVEKHKGMRTHASGERDLPDKRVLGHLLADILSVLIGGKDIDDSLGEAGLLSEDRHGEGGEGRLRGSLDDNGASSGKGRGDLAGLSTGKRVCQRTSVL